MALESINLNDVSFDELVKMDLTERFINELPPHRRLEFCISKLKNKDGLSSVSEREDAIVMLGELYFKLEEGRHDSELSSKEKTEIYARISEIFQWAMNNEPHCVPHHELCYQIASRDMRELIPEMAGIAVNHKSVVSRHEYIECLANISAWPELESILPKILKDPVEDVKATAEYCQDRMKRYLNEPNIGAIEII